MAERASLVSRIVPLVVALFFLLVDQATKYWVAAHVSLGQVAWSWGGDFFWLVHARNTGVAFSMGDALPGPLRSVLFLLVPIVVLILLAIFYWRDKSLFGIQRWALALVLGGGTGNLIDRAFRKHGVVDFLSFKFYGLFGMERWPTFNVADSMVVVGVALLAVSLIFYRKKRSGHPQ